MYHAVFVNETSAHCRQVTIECHHKTIFNTISATKLTFIQGQILEFWQLMDVP